ncbi:GNAT family N-acetyltransferase [Paenibacillus lignilyticus]|uniref:GNAT family N-acetyltransferase n=1 Tax=Paenibacillus lignilyticus TaxID=1172615 RepID=A0ABS5C5N9_9BACL|nr:GNAT family N-acetyltransferase [Paenibacillus lignilyticus]MBP3961312.1 GNAT family N-acetyltransferase [Paenibacillus lignilyticus]
MNKINVTLRTKHLTLRMIDESDISKVHEFVMRNKEALIPWEPARSDEYYTMAFQKQLVQSDMQSIHSGQSVKFWICKNDQPQGDLIGTVTLNNIVRGAFQSCHLGYRMDIAERSKGYMKEALARTISYAWEELNLHRIEANIMPRNTASLRAVEKLGFKQEGLAHDYLRINGEWEDHIHMVLLNPYWEEQ